MPFVLSILVFFGSAPAPAATVDLATLLGTPHGEMPFVRDTVVRHEALVPGTEFADLTTGVLYFASRNGARSAETFQVFREDGSATLADVTAAIETASRDSAIVFAPLVGSDFEELCGKMAEKPDTAFLVTLGEPGYTLSPLFTHCAARNILFVTTLNPELTGLGEYSSYGPLVRLATPGVDLEAPVAPGRTASFLSDAFGMGVAAGQLAETHRKNPNLKGAALLSAFLASEPVLESLRGKVTGAKAVLKFEK